MELTKIASRTGVAIVVTFVMLLSSGAGLVGAQTADEVLDTEQTAKRVRKPISERSADLRATAEESETRRGGLTDEQTTKRTEVCENRKAKMAERMATIGNKGEKIMARVNTAVIKIENFATTNSLTSDEIDSVKAAVSSASANAQADLDVALDLKANIDCTDLLAVRTTLQAYKTAVAEFKTSAKEYVSATKAYAKTVRAASEEA